MKKATEAACVTSCRVLEPVAKEGYSLCPFQICFRFCLAHWAEPVFLVSPF